MGRKKTASSASAWPADVVERRPVADLVPYARNARTHSEEQVAQIAASIREFGFTVPVLIGEDGTIIAGHGRVMAAKALGLVDVPVMTARGWSEAQRRAYVLADNKLTERGGWDDALLALELKDLGDLGFDLGLTGFDAGEIAGILAAGSPGETDPDDVPEAPAVPVSALGDVWVLGRHRLVCGDATDEAAVAKALNGVLPHLCVTDPPYGVNYDPDWRNRADRANGKPYGASAIGLVTNDDRADWTAAYALFRGDVIYVWHPPGAKQVEFFNSLVAAGFEVRMQIVWAKSHFPIGRGNYHVQHEPCWYAVRKGRTSHWAGDRKQTTIWDIDKPAKSETGHSTQKPVECMRRPIENNSSPGQAVYEPFCGSGTTIIAAEMTGRACHAIELSPVYVDVAVLRWQAFAGGEARLEETGETFAEVAARRVPAAPVLQSVE
jgi:DNA modification methylase